MLQPAVFFVLLQPLFSPTPPNLDEFTHPQLAADLAARWQNHLPSGYNDGFVREGVAQYARMSVGQAYKRNTHRHDLTSADCVVLVERVLSLGLARSWDDYYLIQERLRHADGQSAFLERNFSTLRQWVPNNGWLLEDAAASYGVPTASFSFTEFPRAFFLGLEFGVDDTPAGKRKAEARAAKAASVPERYTGTQTYHS